MISADGRYIVFTSDSQGHNGLVFGDTNFDYLDLNGSRDIFIFDRKTGLPTDDNLPVVTVLTPAVSQLSAGQVFNFVAEATSATKSITSVEFFANGSLVGTVTASSVENVNRFSFNWTAPSPGTGNTASRLYELTAIAVDSEGARSLVSNAVPVTVVQIVGIAPTGSIISPQATTTGTGDTAVTQPVVFRVGASLPI